jgi:hypothetical protein
MAPAGQAAGQHTPADHSDSFSRPSFREAAGLRTFWDGY